MLVELVCVCLHSEKKDSELEKKKKEKEKKKKKKKIRNTSTHQHVNTSTQQHRTTQQLDISSANTRKKNSSYAQQHNKNHSTPRKTFNCRCGKVHLKK